MNRREWMMAAAGLALAPGVAVAAVPASLKEAARDAWLYGLPLIEMATTRARAMTGRGSMPAGLNRFGHARQLATPQSRAVTSPNNDTLYSSAWLDLSQGPVTLTIPPTGERYISVAGMSMFTDNNFVLGTRTSGGAGGRYTIVGPRQAGAGPNVVRLETSQGWLLTRILVDGPDDLPAVHRLQDALTLPAFFDHDDRPLAHCARDGFVAERARLAGGELRGAAVLAPLRAFAYFAAASCFSVKV